MSYLCDLFGLLTEGPDKIDSSHTVSLRDARKLSIAGRVDGFVGNGRYWLLRGLRAADNFAFAAAARFCPGFRFERELIK